MGKITTNQSGKACKKDNVFVRKGKKTTPDLGKELYPHVVRDL